MASVEFSDIAHSYLSAPQTEADWALKPLRRRWQDGGAYALLGPSGCGKTTLLNIISGLLAPARGALLFDGEDVTAAPPEQRNIAQVFQFPVVYDTMSVRGNLAFPLKNRGASAAQIKARVALVADLLEISDLLDKPAANLAADAKQIVSLGRGLVRGDIKALLFDEPLTVVDAQIKWRLRAALKRLHAQTGITMIYVTHDQTEALTFADEVAVMADGRIVQSAPPAELFRRPRHRFVGHFIGSPGMNFLPCTVDGGVDGGGGDSVFVGEHKIPVAPFADAGGGKTEIGVRPEFVFFADDGSPSALPAVVQNAKDLGTHKIVTLAVAGGEIKMTAAAGTEIPPAPAVRFSPAYLYEDGELRAAEEAAA